MDKLHFEIEPTCSHCGHKGKLYLKGVEFDRFLRDASRVWLLNSGWRTVMLSVVLGFLTGLLAGK